MYVKTNNNNYITYTIKLHLMPHVQKMKNNQSINRKMK